MNVFASELRVWYGGSNVQPTTYYGWYISASSYHSIHPFNSESKKADFIRMVAGLLPGQDASSIDDIAACAALATWGDDQAQREIGRELLSTYDGDGIARLSESMEFWPIEA